MITGEDESLTIPIGAVGLTLRFADGDLIMVFENGEFRIGDHVIAGDTPAQIEDFAASQSFGQDSSIASILPNEAAGGMMFNNDNTALGELTSSYAGNTPAFALEYISFG